MHEFVSTCQLHFYVGTGVSDFQLRPQFLFYDLKNSVNSFKIIFKDKQL